MKNNLVGEKIDLKENNVEPQNLKNTPQTQSIKTSLNSAGNSIITNTTNYSENSINRKLTSPLKNSSQIKSINNEGISQISQLSMTSPKKNKDDLVSNKKESDFLNLIYMKKDENFAKINSENKTDSSKLPENEKLLNKTSDKIAYLDKFIQSKSSIINPDNNNQLVTKTPKKNKNIENILNSTIGLVNLGNTCYMNTSLQILIHNKYFIHEFLPFMETHSDSGDITEEFYKLLKDIGNSSYSVSPNSFKYTFSKKHKKFSNYQQHDSQEFMRHLLEDLSTEMNQSENKKYRELDTKNKNLFQLNEEYHKLFLEKENSIIIDVFYGQYCNSFICPCNHKEYSFEKFIDIPIYLDQLDSKYTLQNLLEVYFAGDTIDWEAKCESCKRKTEHKKTIKITKLPKILTISFQRYNYRSKSKITKSINFDEKLSILKFCDTTLINNESCEYQLFGISHHSGNLNSGHYFAYCKVEGDWKEFNDSSVSKCYSLKNSSETVYVLFYEKI